MSVFWTLVQNERGDRKRFWQFVSGLTVLTLFIVCVSLLFFSEEPRHEEVMGLISFLYRIESIGLFIMVGIVMNAGKREWYQGVFSWWAGLPYSRAILLGTALLIQILQTALFLLILNVALYLSSLFLSFGIYMPMSVDHRQMTQSTIHFIYQVINLAPMIISFGLMLSLQGHIQRAFKVVSTSFFLIWIILVGLYVQFVDFYLPLFVDEVLFGVPQPDIPDGYYWNLLLPPIGSCLIAGLIFWFNVYIFERKLDL
ncbi:hypothetical protein ACFO25_14705 [Paenactinomyces guangxiensis]|uniref:Uncharacterized protein n=1 Tax=Paenactinomyces guangxiensis TaxID=1490290 RepID=A0A7W1WPZ0_9BACL|nr:hypothetical protein [Paenactinomyces guangxiensis]MBA4493890.1 hypothetical protein [Paenactinomyces guangxiensis]MBH8591356.1 hypothetical protein [Paenactinomyces guangxiensis]